MFACKTETSPALPSMIAPLGALDKLEALVVPEGEIINNIFADAELPSRIERVNPSKLFKSPR